MSLDYAVHSDFLIHWTGKDLDKRYDPNWASARRSGTETPKLQDEYLKRLADTLRYGFWLTETDESPVRFKAGAGTSVIPSTPKVCFTELKLSVASPCPTLRSARNRNEKKIPVRSQRQTLRLFLAFTRFITGMNS